MKITNEMQTQAEPQLNRQTSANPQNFEKMVQSQTEVIKKQELDQLIKNITLQGNKVARSRNFRDLAKFKRMIKDFLQDTMANGYKMQKSHSFSAAGSRKLAIVKEVDAKLIELTEEMRSQEKKTLSLLELIGEIKGLLINLYT